MKGTRKMKKGYGIILIHRISGGLILATMILMAFVTPPCTAQEKGKAKEKQEKSIWTEEEPRGPRGPEGPREGPGGPEGPWAEEGRRGPRGGPPWFELTDETIERIMKELAQSEPAKAAELSKLRQTDPEKFRTELMTAAREHFDKVIRERMETRRRQMQTEYLEWLAKNYPEEAKKLSAIKEKDPNVYIKKFESSMERYGPIFRVRENPELCEILKENLELKDKTDQLLQKIKSAGSENEKKELTAQLEKTVSRRYDLIVKRKEIAYSQLLRRLEELKKHVEENKAEITTWKDTNFKDENVKKRVQELISGFKWD
jgi:hypothetical protein